MPIKPYTNFILRFWVLGTLSTYVYQGKSHVLMFTKGNPMCVFAISCHHSVCLHLCLNLFLCNYLANYNQKTVAWQFFHKEVEASEFSLPIVIFFWLFHFGQPKIYRFRLILCNFSSADGARAPPDTWLTNFFSPTPIKFHTIHRIATVGKQEKARNSMKGVLGWEI